ncbi:formate dehydrogenase accessory sulfurtransferase FdhD [Rhizobium sp. SSA_523]|uniref:formate dehydrogenase accessory sulfurtransferase FdhD n=1 Tax=Rhizobium sp. SSA_523 TaxID=2952477 RepID=UPI00209045A2|nr:formate dehydrogenase accessory sulfurtransferase FdhD [Rhizobium sp. SSA_523]MCO5733613.1 formate dehydrogenase accessory sulfurtransferase FdhD [Rhizobium sp. SSA_523]WKC23090.1 formate dehydrogenase accessory sulfurtransferase FdhD [Rhizobium sp. SSA_523]
MEKGQSLRVSEWQFRQGVLAEGRRIVPEEVPIAFSYGGSTHAVMMATPADLVDFAYGFSLAEEIITKADDILAVEPIEAGGGIDIQITLKDATAEALSARRRRMAGPVGCGLCGIESIEQAVRTVAQVSEPRFALTPQAVADAVRLLGEGQDLNRETRAVHAAGYLALGRVPEGQKPLLAIREDVGRHNALDKLCGAVLRAERRPDEGAVVVTSRLSVEMVQKTALLRCPFLIAISAPTALAIETAQQAGMTLIGIARGAEFEVFTRPDRLMMGEAGNVAESHG